MCEKCEVKDKCIHCQGKTDDYAKCFTKKVQKERIFLLNRS